MRERLGWKDILANVAGDAQILIVDDDLRIRDSLEKLLTSFGDSVKKAASAEEADAWFTSQPFDLVMLDVEMPRMNGLEFLRWVQTRDKEVAVIMVTGVDDPTVALECLEAGARTYLVKPIMGDFLRVAVRDALAVRRILVERNDLRQGF